MKRFCFSFAFIASIFMLFGCKSTPNIVNQIVPGVDNEAWVVTVTSESSNEPTDYGKTCKVIADDSQAPQEHNREIKEYTENALRSVGYIVVSADQKADLTIVCHYYTVQNRRLLIFYELTATEKEKVVWKVQTSCGSPVRPIRAFLPGLAAASIPYIGTNRNRAVVNLKENPQYLQAVMTNRTI